MLRYVLRRFLLLIPMVLAASVIIFLMLRLGTGDPALDYLRLSNLPPTAPGCGRRCILISASHLPRSARCWTIC